MEDKEKLRPYMRQFYRGNGWCLALAILQIVLVTVMNLMVSWLIQIIVDYATGMDGGYSMTELILLTVAGMGVMVLGYGCAYHSKPRFVARAIGQYKEFVFEQLSRKSISAFNGENTALYISALSNDANTIEAKYLMNIFNIIENVLVFLGALVMMLCYNVELTLVSIVLSLLPVAASLLVGNRIGQAEKHVSDRNESYMSTLKDSLMGFSVVKTFQAEVQMCRMFAQRVRELENAVCIREKVMILVQLLTGTAGLILQFGVFLVGAWLAVTRENFSVGTLMVFVQMMNYIIRPIARVPQYYAEYKSAKALILKIADALSRNVREEGRTEQTELKQGITVKDLSFRYEEEKKILRNISVTFEAGRSYAIVGASGSGKSTLLNLLMASNPSYSGTISYDGTDLKDISSGSLYEMVSMVQQNVFIFNASIRDNITMFTDFPGEDVDRAIALSGLSALVAERGADYLCGENGSGLSGGEKQRISIARSLLKKSQVLLVDEATAALDANTAFQISNSILALSGLTRIVITHALDKALLEQYDGIIALKSGSIAECGTFAELMENKGYFYSLYTVSQ